MISIARHFRTTDGGIKQSWRSQHWPQFIYFHFKHNRFLLSMLLFILSFFFPFIISLPLELFFLFLLYVDCHCIYFIIYSLFFLLCFLVAVRGPLLQLLFSPLFFFFFGFTLFSDGCLTVVVSILFIYFLFLFLLALVRPSLQFFFFLFFLLCFDGLWQPLSLFYFVFSSFFFLVALTRPLLQDFFPIVTVTKYGFQWQYFFITVEYLLMAIQK